MITTTRSRVTLATLAVLAIAAAVTFWMLENPPMDEIEVSPPTDEQLDAAAGTHVFFAHQSVGWNILHGVEQTYQDAGREEAPRVVETTQPDESDWFIAHTQIGVNGDPLGKLHDYAEALSGPLAEQVDMAVLKFCYLDVTAETDVDALFAEYSATIEALERQHPDIRFLYATVPLNTDRSWRASLKAMFGAEDQAGPRDNIARERYNELVRDAYADTGRLFDIAAVEATMSQAPTLRDDHGDEYYVLNRALAVDLAHLNDLGSRLAAAEFLQVIASNAGT